MPARADQNWRESDINPPGDGIGGITGSACADSDHGITDISPERARRVPASTFGVHFGISRLWRLFNGRVITFREICLGRQVTIT